MKKKIEEIKDIIWKPIVGFSNYMVASNGDVLSLSFTSSRNVRIVTPKRHPGGYRQVLLCKGKKRSYKYIHRLVAICFIDNPYSKEEVNHIDGNKSDNKVENLEWVTKSENSQHYNSDRDTIKNAGIYAKISPIEKKTDFILYSYDVDKIKSLSKNNKLSNYEIAKIFNVHYTLIEGILNMNGVKRNLPIGEKHHATNITYSDAQNIINDYQTGKYTYKKLVDKYNISKDTIGKIMRGEHWSVKK